MRSWRIDLPYSKPPLSMNQRLHYAAHARIKAQVRADTAVLVRAAGVPPLRAISIDLHYVPRDRRRRDPLNLVATLKCVEDGVVDAGVIPDDTPDYLLPTMPTIDKHDPSDLKRRLYVVIAELETP
jgi:crossover junction endodeoxyribonuclease RusA